MFVVVSFCHSCFVDEYLFFLFVQFPTDFGQIDLWFMSNYLIENRSLDHNIETVDSTQTVTALHFPVDYFGGLFLLLH